MSEAEKEESDTFGFIQLSRALSAQLAEMEQRWERRLQLEIDRLNKRIDDLGKAR